MRWESWVEMNAPTYACPAWDANLPGDIWRSSRMMAYRRNVGSGTYVGLLEKEEGRGDGTSEV
jgi:hypothetical protein